MNTEPPEFDFAAVAGNAFGATALVLMVVYILSRAVA
jgi:hypothetical protein